MDTIKLTFTLTLEKGVDHDYLLAMLAPLAKQANDAYYEDAEATPADDVCGEFQCDGVDGRWDLSADLVG